MRDTAIIIIIISPRVLDNIKVITLLWVVAE